MTPHTMGGTSRSQQGKRGGTADGPQDVEPACRQRFELAEKPGGAVGDGCHDGGDGDEQDREHQPRREPRFGELTKADQTVARTVDLHRERGGQPDEQGEQRRRPPVNRSCSSGSDKPDPDAEERTEQDEVGEERQVQDVLARQANQGELDKEH